MKKEAPSSNTPFHQKKSEHFVRSRASWPGLIAISPLFLLFLTCCSNNPSIDKAPKEVFPLDIKAEVEPVSSHQVAAISQDKHQEQGNPNVSCTQGIVLIGSESMVLSNSTLQEVRGVQAYGVDVPGGVHKLEKKIFARYCDRPLDEKNILQLIDDITDYYKDHLHPFVVVEVPRQNIASGVLQLQIIESRLGNVNITGNHWRDSARSLKYIQLKRNDVLDEQLLLKDLQFMNRNPFRRVDYIYEPGEKEYTTDLTLYVEDRRPVRFYLGSDNSGVATTGRLRWFGGFNLAYLFGDDNLSYQYTTSDDLRNTFSNNHKFLANTLQYLLLLPCHHVLNLYGGYSKVHVHMPSGVKNHGSSGQASMRYTIPLNPTRFLNHEVDVGADYKRTNNTVEFSELFPKIGQTINLTQIMGKYAGNFEERSYRINYDMELYWSPGKWLPHQKKSNFQSLQPGATTHWIYAKSAFSYSQKMFWDMWFFGMLRGQYSWSTLIPSEQIGIGGFDTVRGYTERELNKDTGFIGNIELRTPAMRLL